MTGWRSGASISVGTLDHHKDIVKQGHRKMKAADRSYVHSPCLPVICLIQARSFKHSGTMKRVGR